MAGGCSTSSGTCHDAVGVSTADRAAGLDPMYPSLASDCGLGGALFTFLFPLHLSSLLFSLFSLSLSICLSLTLTLSLFLQLSLSSSLSRSLPHSLTLSLLITKRPFSLHELTAVAPSPPERASMDRSMHSMSSLQELQDPHP